MKIIRSKVQPTGKGLYYYWVDLTADKDGAVIKYYDSDTNKWEILNTPWNSELDEILQDHEERISWNQYQISLLQSDVNTIYISAYDLFNYDSYSISFNHILYPYNFRNYEGSLNYIGQMPKLYSLVILDNLSSDGFHNYATWYEDFLEGENGEDNAKYLHIITRNILNDKDNPKLIKVTYKYEDEGTSNECLVFQSYDDRILNNEYYSLDISGDIQVGTAISLLQVYINNSIGINPKSWGLLTNMYAYRAGSAGQYLMPILFTSYNYGRSFRFSYPASIDSYSAFDVDGMVIADADMKSDDPTTLVVTKVQQIKLSEIGSSSSKIYKFPTDLLDIDASISYYPASLLNDIGIEEASSSNTEAELCLMLNLFIANLLLYKADSYVIIDNTGDSYTECSPVYVNAELYNNSGTLKLIFNNTNISLSTNNNTLTVKIEYERNLPIYINNLLNLQDGASWETVLAAIKKDSEYNICSNKYGSLDILLLLFDSKLGANDQKFTYTGKYKVMNSYYYTILLYTIEGDKYLMTISENKDLTKELITDTPRIVFNNNTNPYLKPNIYYTFGEVSSLNINFSEPETSGVVNEYLFEFISGTTPTTLTMPSNIKWQVTPTILANKTYQISVINNLAVIGEWDNTTA